MNPAACARAKKAARLELERTLTLPEGARVASLPPTPEDAALEAYCKYRKATRPFRRAFRGIITRREAELFVRARVSKQVRIAKELRATLEQESA